MRSKLILPNWFQTIALWATLPYYCVQQIARWRLTKENASAGIVATKKNQMHNKIDFDTVYK